ncbi:MAG: ribosome assembly RNA-binding protein YhbY [Methylococcaceae bacterium]
MNSAEKKQLKSQAHSLKPVIIVGQSGLSESVLKEINITLDTHELIKIKIRAEKDVRTQIRDQIITETKSELIQTIGQMIAIYRQNPDK